MFDWWIIIVSGIVWYISYAVIFNMKDTQEFIDTMLYSQYPKKGYEYSWRVILVVIIYRISQASFVLLLIWNIIKLRGLLK